MGETWRGVVNGNKDGSCNGQIEGKVRHRKSVCEESETDTGHIIQGRLSFSTFHFFVCPSGTHVLPLVILMQTILFTRGKIQTLKLSKYEKLISALIWHHI